MRKIFIFLLALSSLLSCAQMEDYCGVYYYETGGQKYHLTLNNDGTFFFSHYWKISTGIDPSANESGSEHGKGTWNLKSGTVRFYAESESDIGQNHRLNFNRTVAHIKDKSQLVFTNSEMFWLENLKMKKIE